jgi:hypothetical protein
VAVAIKAAPSDTTIESKPFSTVSVIRDRGEASNMSAMSAVPLKAEVKSGYWHVPRWAFLG